MRCRTLRFAEAIGDLPQALGWAAVAAMLR
jgi:hypothetical protein